MRQTLRVLLALALGFLSFVPERAEAAEGLSPPLRLDVVATDRVELGLTSASRVGILEDVELGAVLPTLWLHPALALRQRWLSSSRALVTFEYRLSYPSWFLELVSKEGSFGLLPATTDVPIIFGAEIREQASLSVLPGHWLTASGSLGVAPRFFESAPLPLLDFPFLYQRFGYVYAPFTALYGLHADGAVGSGFYYHAAFEWYVLPLTDMPGVWAWETAAELGWATGRWRFELGLRVAEARFPVGVRLHWLPVFDVGYGIDR